MLSARDTGQTLAPPRGVTEPFPLPPTSQGFLLPSPRLHTDERTHLTLKPTGIFL